MSIWDPSLWLPRNITWEHMKPTKEVLYPTADDVFLAIGLGAILLVVRILVEAYLFVPIGWLFGWVREPLSVRIHQHLTGGFMGKSRLKKVSECGWRFIYYVSAFISGYFILRDQPQFADVTECWRNWPSHPLPIKVYWYYVMETAFYWSLLFSQLFLDIRRHDFLQMVLHHAVTLLLLYISWTMNMVRVGTLVLFSHDAADIFIELGKLLRYAGWQRLLTIDFLVVLLIWFATRLFYYPFWIIRSILFDAPRLIQDDYSWANLSQKPIVPRILMVMLCTLLVLHCFWTFLLLKVAHNAMTTSEVDDIREESDSDEDEAKKNE